MPKTYEPIATTTLSAGTASVTFNSIPQTYTDLVISTSTYYASSTAMVIRFNNDTGTNYSYTYLGGSQGAPGAASGRQTNLTYINLLGYYNTTNSTGNIFLPTVAHIMNYSNTTTNKTLLSRGYSVDNSNNSDVELFAGLWRSTSAITRIDLIGQAGNFASGSTFTLYGIKAA